jgi:predicted ATPase
LAQDRRVLQHAALLGYRFDAILLALATQRDLAGLIASLARCCAAGIIVAQDDDGYRWKFNHALVHQRFAVAVPESRRRRYHERTMAALETVPDSTSRVDQLAYHASESGVAEKARLYNERAGDLAFHLRALPEAGHYFSVALAAATDDLTAIRLRTKLAAVKEHRRAPT